MLEFMECECATVVHGQVGTLNSEKFLWETHKTGGASSMSWSTWCGARAEAGGRT